MLVLFVTLSRERRKGRRRQGFEDYIGYDVAQVRRECLNKGDIPVNALMEINKDNFSSIKIDPSSWN